METHPPEPTETTARAVSDEAKARTRRARAVDQATTLAHGDSPARVSAAAAELSRAEQALSTAMEARAEAAEAQRDLLEIKTLAEEAHRLASAAQIQGAALLSRMESDAVRQLRGLVDRMETALRLVTLRALVIMFSVTVLARTIAFTISLTAPAGVASVAGAVVFVVALLIVLAFYVRERRRHPDALPDDDAPTA